MDFFLQNIVKYAYDLSDDETIEHLLANNPSISPTAHHGLSVSLNYYCKYAVGTQLYTKPGITWEEVMPWERMLQRTYQMFEADFQLNAPKDRTLFDYK